MLVLHGIIYEKVAKLIDFFEKLVIAPYPYLIGFTHFSNIKGENH